MWNTLIFIYIEMFLLFALDDYRFSMSSEILDANIYISIYSPPTRLTPLRGGGLLALKSVQS